MLERLAGGRVRVWRVEGGRARPVAGVGAPPAWAPPLDGDRGGRRWDPPDGPAWFEPVRDAEGVWLETVEGGASPPAVLAAIVGSVLAAEQDATQGAAEPSESYGEIDLI